MPLSASFKVFFASFVGNVILVELLILFVIVVGV